MYIPIFWSDLINSMDHMRISGTEPKFRWVPYSDFREVKNISVFSTRNVHMVHIINVIRFKMVYTS